MALLKELGPEALESPGEDPDLLGMKSLMEERPEDTAEWAKEQGNFAVKEAQELAKQGQPKQRRQRLQRALEMYTTAADLRVNSSSQQSVYHSNRAHVHLLLGNNRHALADADAAIALDANNVKAHFRAAKAALLLGKYKKVVESCQQGQRAAEEQGQGRQAELEKMEKEASRKLEEQAAAAARSREVIKSATAMCDALRRRRVKVGEGLFQEATRGQRPQLDPASGLLHWPVVLCYPEPMAVDLIQDFCETDTFGAHLRTILCGWCHVFESPEPLEWDAAGAYRRDTVEVYYQTHSSGCLSPRELLLFLLEDKAGLSEEDKEAALSAAAKTPSPGAPGWGPKKWRKVDRGDTLGSVLSSDDCIVTGVPGYHPGLVLDFQLNPCQIPPSQPFLLVTQRGIGDGMIN